MKTALIFVSHRAHLVIVFVGVRPHSALASSKIEDVGVVFYRGDMLPPRL